MRNEDGRKGCVVCKEEEASVATDGRFRFCAAMRGLGCVGPNRAMGRCDCSRSFLDLTSVVVRFPFSPFLTFSSRINSSSVCHVCSPHRYRPCRALRGHARCRLAQDRRRSCYARPRRLSSRLPFFLPLSVDLEQE
jgi:hypothetical protein